VNTRNRARLELSSALKIEPGSIFVVVLLALPLLISGCGTFSGPRKSTQADTPGRAPSQGRGGYYLDDGPGENPPANLDDIPDAVPRVEPINRATSRPYSVMGRSYTPMTDLSPYRERGLATWYGRRYHGKSTSSGETYDMYRMTAAHTTLPIPSYARVTNVDNGRSVVVRINDRGPFVGERLIDLSYVAAHKLDLLRNGSATVEVESVVASGPVSAAPARIEQKSLSTSVAVPPEPPLQTRVPADPPVSLNPAGHYVQLGAFSVKENADRFLERVRALLDADQLSVNLVPAGALYRIQAGPYPDRTTAEQAALKFEAILGSTPVLTSPR
jgi:rare lipoprotein A